MSAITYVNPAELAVAPSKPEENYITHEKGFLSWIFTVDHKRIGLMYLVSVLAAFALGGFFALAIRTELFTSGPTIMTHDQYNQAMTLHGAVMVFLVIIPGIPAALGNIIMPLQLGAKDVAFPRLNLMSYHLWIVGALFLISSMVISAADTGWTFY
ncbi:MAG: cbb3-type cytochrome c oxidase subunit I, partial [Polyangiaceae bacterium]|nr:cbb3-type cytochrome c oxidase subunit I [Polyangiaceae bacterium]